MNCELSIRPGPYRMQNHDHHLSKADQRTTWTILEVLNWTTSYFRSRAIETGRLDAEVLLAHALKLDRMALYLRHDQPLSREELADFKALIRRRAAREPVAYILGKKGFWDLDLMVDPSVLIPRPETENLVEIALDLLPEVSDPPARVLELGTGSGAIILSLAAHRPKHRFYASDLSTQSLRVAGKNASSLGLEQRILFFAGDWLCPVKKTAISFDLILSNPPYIPSGAISHLMPEVSRYEPKGALDGGVSGLDAVFHLIDTCSLHLGAGGYFLMEIGHDQGKAALERADHVGAFQSFEIKKDYGGKDRVLVLKK